MIVHWLYTALVRPILLYGNIVWWPSLDKNCNLRILPTIQRSAELCISGALRTTATEALNTILDLQPLDLLAKSWASATALRLREAAAWTTGSTGHSNILSKHSPLPRNTDYVPPIVTFERRYKTYIPTRTPGQPPTSIRKRRQHIHRRLQASLPERWGSLFPRTRHKSLIPPTRPL